VARASVAFARFGSRDHEALGVHANWSGPSAIPPRCP